MSTKAERVEDLRAGWHSLAAEVTTPVNIVTSLEVDDELRRARIAADTEERAAAFAEKESQLSESEMAALKEQHEADGNSSEMAISAAADPTGGGMTAVAAEALFDGIFGTKRNDGIGSTHDKGSKGKSDGKSSSSGKSEDAAPLGRKSKPGYHKVQSSTTSPSHSKIDASKVKKKAEAKAKSGFGFKVGESQQQRAKFNHQKYLDMVNSQIKTARNAQEKQALLEGANAKVSAAEQELKERRQALANNPFYLDPSPKAPGMFASEQDKDDKGGFY